MRNFKLFTMIFAIMATLCFTACENDNDKKQETNTCEPASCEMVENATEMGCDDAGHCIVKACADTFKVAEDAKSCEVDTPACICDPICKEDEDCIKGEDGTCGCRAKDKPVNECLCDDDTDCPDGDKGKCPKEPTQPTPVK